MPALGRFGRGLGFLFSLAAGLALAAGAFATWAVLAPPPPLDHDCSAVRGPCAAGEGGHAGTYTAALPAGASRGTVLFLHGAGGSGAGSVRYLAPLVVEARRHALLAPSALPHPRDGVAAWSLSGAPAARRDEARFLRAVLEDAAGRLRVATDRVLVIGHSRGGAMAWELACRQPALAAAYAPIGGGMYRPLPRFCRGGVPVLHQHALGDGVVPLEGRPDMAAMRDNLDLLRGPNGCAVLPGERALAQGGFRLDWRDCDPGRPLALLVEPGAHPLAPRQVVRALDWFERLGAAR